MTFSPFRVAVTLFYKEFLRFFRIFVQTVLSPVLTSVLYLFVFSRAIPSQGINYVSGSYLGFLIPGLIIMTMLQAAFMNSSTSITIAKVTGNLHFLLTAPISPSTFYLSYVSASIVRACLSGFSVWLGSLLFFWNGVAHPAYVFCFGILGSAILGALGMIAGIWGRDFDHLEFFNSFVIFPMTFLSAVFFPLSRIPADFQILFRMNPFFYIVEGFRFGFLGQADCQPVFALFCLLCIFVFVSLVSYCILVSGYRLRE